MALTYDQLSAITYRKFIPKMVDNIFDSDPILQRAKSKGWYTSQNGGLTINQPLMYAQTSSAGSYNPTDTLNTTDNDQFTSAQYDWRFYYANISITRADELKNSGDSQILDFVKNKVQAAEMTLKDDLCDGIYSDGSSATDIGGLRLIVDSANTVGGISQSTYSWWQAQENSSTTVTTLAALNTMYNTLTINSKHPSVGMTTRAIYGFIWNLFQPQQRFMDSESAKGGFQSLMMNGVPIIMGSKVPASHFFWLCEEFLNLYYHPQEDFRFEKFQTPINQNLKVAKVYWAGNLTSSNNRMHGKFTALAS
jgi:hypothetical protein